MDAFLYAGKTHGSTKIPLNPYRQAYSSGMQGFFDIAMGFASHSDSVKSVVRIPQGCCGDYSAILISMEYFNSVWYFSRAALVQQGSAGFQPACCFYLIIYFMQAGSLRYLFSDS